MRDNVRRWIDRRDAAPYKPRPFAVAYVLLLVVGAVGTGFAYLLLLALAPSADRLDVVKTALTVVAGSGAGAALYVSYRKQRNDETDSVREQDKLFTERYTQAVAQLGNPSAAIRIGGVHALARIADDSRRDRATCLGLICSYLQMPTQNSAEEEQVRNTALRLLVDRLRPSHPHHWIDAEIDLSGAMLNQANFDGIRVCFASFRDAKFKGAVSFRNSEFTGDGHDVGVDFMCAKFMEFTSFSYVRFSGSYGIGGARFSRSDFAEWVNLHS